MKMLFILQNGTIKLKRSWKYSEVLFCNFTDKGENTSPTFIQIQKKIIYPIKE